MQPDMTKVQNTFRTIISTPNAGGVSHGVVTNLDTLAQPRKVNDSKGYSEAKISFQKRARARLITDAIVLKLVDLQSPLKKSYWQTWHCSRAILQDGDKLRAKYCNQRWCLLCNRLRTAKLMNGYVPVLEKMANPQFVTLTIPNVTAENLKVTIEKMTHTFNQCRDVLRKQGTRTIGIRKTECTVNETTLEYHPHFHLVVDGADEANAIVKQWLLHNPNASAKAQDVTECTAAQELFKYFTKLLTKTGQFLPVHMDVIFRAMKGKRVYQPFGGITKVSEDVDAKYAVTCDWKEPQSEIWVYENADIYSDWYNSSGEALAEVIHEDVTMRLVLKIQAILDT
jgi:Replication protein